MILDDEKSTDHTVTHVASKTTIMFIIYINNFDKAQKWYSISESVETHTLESNFYLKGTILLFLLKLNRTWVESLDRRQQS